MAIEPFRSFWESEFLSIKQEMDRIFDEFFGKPLIPEREEERWFFPVDMIDTGSHLIVLADLPDVDPKEVSITVSDGKLTISGERKREYEWEIRGYLRSERYEGPFQRVIPLPIDVVAEEAKASYKDGVLRIVFPKYTERAKRKIKIGIN